MAKLIPFSYLPAYEWLDTPMWVYDLKRRSMFWANTAGVAFWNASSLEDLCNRNFSDISESTLTRLQIVTAEHAKGNTTRDQWTLYPKGKPVTLSAHGTSVMLPDRSTGILYEGLSLGQKPEPSIVRGIEALQHTPVLISLYDWSGRCLMMNPAATSALDTIDADNDTETFYNLFKDREQAETLRKTLHNGQKFSSEIELCTKNGAVWHVVDAHRVLDPVYGKPAILINARDISDLKQAEIELFVAKEAAEAASLAKSRFLATMSHEIRTPMNGVLGMAQLLLQESLSDAERYEYATVILTSGRELLTLLNDILDLSKVEAGKLELESVPFNVEELISEITQLFGASAHQKNLNMETAWKESGKNYYRGDPVRIRQMLSNLVSNAIKFTHDGFVHIEAAEIECGDRDAILEFAVSDTGIGILPDKLNLLFMPFSQGDSSTTRQFGGSGLGLSIVRSFADLMEGSVGVSSHPGKGSRFWFRIRVAPVRNSEKPDGSVNTATKAYSTGMDLRQALIHVMVVDDNIVNRKVIEAILKKNGISFECSENGLQAFEMAKIGRFDLILMDCQMPVIDGFTSTQLIRNWENDHQEPRTPIVALTAAAFQDDKDRCIASGMDDFITKPINMNELLTVINKWANMDDKLSRITYV